jgi:hypothetical protein
MGGAYNSPWSKEMHTKSKAEDLKVKKSLERYRCRRENSKYII